MSRGPLTEEVPVKLATTEEVAAVLQIHPRTVLRLLAAGEIPAAIDRVNLKRFRLADVIGALAKPATSSKP